MSFSLRSESVGLVVSRHQRAPRLPQLISECSIQNCLEFASYHATADPSVSLPTLHLVLGDQRPLPNLFSPLSTVVFRTKVAGHSFHVTFRLSYLTPAFLCILPEWSAPLLFQPSVQLVHNLPCCGLCPELTWSTPVWSLFTEPRRKTQIKERLGGRGHLRIKDRSQPFAAALLSLLSM